MILLAIETSTDVCSAALSINGSLSVDHRLAAQQHGALILPMIDALMVDAGIQPGQLDGVVFGRGPGSFTGVRIAVALTQGIALGADVGVIGVSTLQAVAQCCNREHAHRHVAVSLDARMDEVYFAAYSLSDLDLMMPVSDERVCPPAAIPVLPAAQTWHWAGSGAERYSELTGKSLVSGCQPHARDLLTIAQPQAEAGRFEPPEQAMPVYLRDKVAQTTAERESVARHKQTG